MDGIRREEQGMAIEGNTLWVRDVVGSVVVK